MKKLLLTFFFVVILAGCSSKKEPELVPYNPPETEMSQHTELKSSPERTVSIHIPTAKCATCKKTLSAALERVNGVIFTEIDLTKKLVSVKFISSVTNTDIIKKTISDAGYDADDLRRNKSAYENLPDCCRDDSNEHI